MKSIRYNKKHKSKSSITNDIKKNKKVDNLCLRKEREWLNKKLEKLNEKLRNMSIRFDLFVCYGCKNICIGTPQYMNISWDKDFDLERSFCYQCIEHCYVCDKDYVEGYGDGHSDCDSDSDSSYYYS